MQPRAFRHSQHVGRGDPVICCRTVHACRCTVSKTGLPPTRKELLQLHGTLPDSREQASFCLERARCRKAANSADQPAFAANLWYNPVIAPKTAASRDAALGCACCSICAPPGTADREYHRPSFSKPAHTPDCCLLQHALSGMSPPHSSIQHSYFKALHVFPTGTRVLQELLVQDSTAVCHRRHAPHCKGNISQPQIPR